MAAVREFRLADDLGVVDPHDAQPDVVGDVDVLTVGLDDVTLVDADLLRVGPGEVVGGHVDRRRSDGRLGAPLGLRGRSRGVLGSRHHHVAAHRDDPAAAETPCGDPLGGLGLHVAKQSRAVAEEREMARCEALRLARRVSRRGSAGVGRRGSGRPGGRLGRRRAGRRARRRLAGRCRHLGTVRRARSEGDRDAEDRSDRQSHWAEQFTLHALFDVTPGGSGSTNLRSRGAGAPEPPRRGGRSKPRRREAHRAGARRTSTCPRRRTA